MRTLTRIFQNLSLIVAFLLIFLLLIPTLIGIKPYVIVSSSMEPTIKTGSVVYVNTYKDAEDIQENDVISYRINDGQVTHRVVCINENHTFTTKGDANNTVDSNQVSFSDYIGETIFSIPYLGILFYAMKTKIGITILFVVVFLNIIILLFDNQKVGEENEQKK